MIFWHWWLLRQIMIDMLTISETLHPCSCAKERISGNLEFPSALETVTQRCFTGRSMHMFPRQGGQLANVECPHLSFSPFLTRKQREAWIVIWSTWTLDDLEFLGSLFQVWLKSQQRILHITAFLYSLSSSNCWSRFSECWISRCRRTINRIVKSIAVVWVSNLPPTSMVFGEISIAVLDLHLYVPSGVSCSLWYTLI